MILKLACICWVWSKRIETQVKSHGNTFRELLSSRLHVCGEYRRLLALSHPYLLFANKFAIMNAGIARKGSRILG